MSWTERYEKIRAALEMGPTPGPWEAINGTDVFTPLGARNAAGVEAAADDGWYIADCDMGPSFTENGREKIPYVEKQANASLIAACDPGTIRALLDERDALVAENARLEEMLRELEGREQRDEDLLRQVLEVLSSTRQTALEHAMKARMLEGIVFAEIFQDLDFVVDILRERLGVKA